MINVGGWRKDHYKGFELVGTCSQNFCSLGSNFELKSCWLLALVKKINEKWHFMYTSFRQKSWRILAKLFLIICAFTLGNNKIPVLSHGGTAKKFFILPSFFYISSPIPLPNWDPLRNHEATRHQWMNHTTRSLRWISGKKNEYTYRIPFQLEKLFLLREIHQCFIFSVYRI